MFSFGIIAANFEVFENDIFNCKVLWMVGESEWDSVGFFALWRLQCGFSIDFLGMMFACGDSGVRVATFFEKLAYFLALAIKVGVVTTEAP